MIAEVMKEVKNYFVSYFTKGTFVVQNGSISLPDDFPPCNYIFISGSSLNNGVFNLSDENQRIFYDETFTGLVFALAPPNDFLTLVERISLFKDKNPASNIVSESFGPYSYSISPKLHSDSDWRKTFKEDLNPYRKMFSDLEVAP